MLLRGTVGDGVEPGGVGKAPAVALVCVRGLAAGFRRLDSSKTLLGSRRGVLDGVCSPHCVSASASSSSTAG